MIRTAFVRGDQQTKDKRYLVFQPGIAYFYRKAEAAAGGPIALLETDDLILLNIEERKLEIVGVKGRELAEEEIEKILEERKRAWRPKEEKYKSGVLKIYSEHAVSPMKGGYMK